VSRRVVIVFGDNAEADLFYAALTAKSEDGESRYRVGYDDQVTTERGTSYPEEWPGLYSVSSTEIADC
jgi:hypothetical protein